MNLKQPHGDSPVQQVSQYYDAVKTMLPPDDQMRVQYITSMIQQPMPMQMPANGNQNYRYIPRVNNIEMQILKQRQMVHEQISIRSDNDLDHQQLAISAAPNQPYSREPELLNCKSCKATGLSEVELRSGWGSCFCGTLLLCLFFLACCMRECKDAHHFCKNCGEKIGIYHFICD